MCLLWFVFVADVLPQIVQLKVIKRLKKFVSDKKFLFAPERSFTRMHSLMFGEIVSSMEAFVANFTIEFLLSLVLPRVPQPIIFSNESLSTCIASESIKGERKFYEGASPKEEK